MVGGAGVAMKIESKKEGKRGKENANLLLREDD
jgi:hypothetical protein